MGRLRADDPAFAYCAAHDDGYSFPGLTVRAWLAGHAATGILAGEGPQLLPAEVVSARAVSIADALIAELAKAPK